MTTTTTFEQYVATWNANTRNRDVPDHCPCCGNQRESLVRSGECEACMRYHHGYDQARDVMLDAMIGGAVRGALRAGLSSDAVLGAVARAIDADHGQSEDEMFRMLTGMSVAKPIQLDEEAKA